MTACKRTAALLAVAFAILLPAAPALAVPALAAPAVRAAASAAEPRPVVSYPPGADRRLVRVSTALARDPLFVDPELAFALGKADRARLRAAMATAGRELGRPVFVVVVPNPRESESQGRNEALLFALHDRLRRDGFYLMADARGSLEAVGFNVPRYFGYSELDSAPDSDHPFTGLADRLIKRLDDSRTATTAPPTMPNLWTPPDPFGQEDRLSTPEAELKSPFLLGLFLIGPLAAIALYWAGRWAISFRSIARKETKGTRQGARGAPAKPTVRWLRRTGAAELARLRAMLPEAEGDPGHTYAASAFDAAQILYDDAGGDRERTLDLVGAIVLARQGQAALADKDPTPRPPCFVNPLHGPSTTRRVTKLVPGQSPVCESCDGKPVKDLPAKVLRVPGPDGPRPHYKVPGVWRDTAFGAKGKDFVPRVLEYLGVD
ncbi:hypothetical protein [Actinomadura rudentiformis]|uniref:DUF4350 domain-containing protein n=1 Tax=Actinomadura rudentiformis TaxID=359158 RepID=A0A6H9YXD2_9ACTN|nr:hypothetical protein [Actinomadura rudentiformis]KAB2346492.1 hypothetical protein F8566_23865 [Actinomadura rudentiformis]